MPTLRFLPLVTVLLLTAACGGDGPAGPNDDDDDDEIGTFSATVTGDLTVSAEGSSTFLVADGRTAILMNAQGGTSFTLQLDVPGGRPGPGTYDVSDIGLGSIGSQTWTTTSGTLTISSSSSSRLVGTLTADGSSHQQQDEFAVSATFSATCSIIAPSCD